MTTRGVRIPVVALLLPALLLACGSAEPGATPTATSLPTPPATTEPPSEPSITATSTSPPQPPPPSTSVPPTDLPESLFGTDWERISTTRRIVALTFDGGSSDAAVASVLATLGAAHVPATFFLTGDFARRYPDQVRRIAAGGHRVGNHSDRHLAYPDLTDDEIRADLARAEAAIVAAGGGAAKPFFRFPFGDRTSADIRAVNGNGYVCIRWTVDTLGWKGTSGGITEAIVRQRVLDAAQPGEIVLMHLGANPDDGTTLDADALPEIINELSAMGYSFVTLDTMLG